MRRRDFIRAIVGSSTKAGIIFCLLALFACQVASADIGRARDASDNVLVASNHANDVITNVRAMFEKDKQEKTPTEINKLVKTVLGLVYMDLRKHSIETNVNLSERLPTIFGNEVQSAASNFEFGDECHRVDEFSRTSHTIYKH